MEPEKPVDERLTHALGLMLQMKLGDLEAKRNMSIVFFRGSGPIMAYTLLGRLRGGLRGARTRGRVGFARLRGKTVAARSGFAGLGGRLFHKHL